MAADVPRKIGRVQECARQEAELSFKIKDGEGGVHEDSVDAKKFAC